MAAAAARSMLRSSASLLRAAPARASSSAARPSLRRALGAPPRLLRSPVEASFCVESLLPLHSATAAARMTSMLAVPGRGLGWLTEGMIMVPIIGGFPVNLVTKAHNSTGKNEYVHILVT
ncbi:hypothetical protein ACQJBY_021980 [Aegilops geniculata]